MVTPLLGPAQFSERLCDDSLHFEQLVDAYLTWDVDDVLGHTQLPESLGGGSSATVGTGGPTICMAMCGCPSVVAITHCT